MDKLLAFKYISAFVIGGLLGNLFLSILISRLLHGRDIRDVGSGNPGATNMARQNGLASGIATLVFDILKSVLSVYLGNRLCGDWGTMLAGLGCIIGHCYPFIHHFAGGKGIAVGVVLCFVIHWSVGAGAVVAFLIGALISKKVSVGSVCACLTVVVMSLALPITLPMKILGVVAALLALFRHRDNIKRILAGTEPDFKFKK